MANAQTVNKYRLFEKHGNTAYHSPHLPLPNVVRIEVLSPEAKARYLGKFHSIMETFRQELTKQMMDPEANKPFYAFFDPTQNGEIGFDLSADWDQAQNTGIKALTGMIRGLPGIGGFADATGFLGIAEGAADLFNRTTKMLGMNNDSTGACTMKEFSKADFQFTKTLKCSWYMPEQEDMARLSISRLLKMAYVRNLSRKAMDDLGGKVASALKNIPEVLKGIDSEHDDVTRRESDTTGKNGDGGVVEKAKDAAKDAANAATDKAAEAADSAAETASSWSEAGLNAVSEFFNDPTVSNTLSMVGNAGLKINEFFGGVVTINPLPVRLTMGHQLDIEPLVITNVKISGSPEQFMSDDGTNIPLFVNAEISFKMWMIPDPNKGFMRYLGDDIFNGSSAAGKAKSSGGGNGGGSGKGGSGKGGSGKGSSGGSTGGSSGGKKR